MDLGCFNDIAPTIQEYFAIQYINSPKVKCGSKVALSYKINGIQYDYREKMLLKHY